MKNYIIYYRFKGAEYRELPMNTFMITDVTKKNAKERFLCTIENGGMEAKVIRIDEVK